MLAKNRAIKHGVDYVLKPADRTICIYLKSVYTLFKKQFKQTEDSGVFIPDIKDIQNQAKNKGYKVGHSTNFGEISKRAMVVDVGKAVQHGVNLVLVQRLVQVLLQFIEKFRPGHSCTPFSEKTGIVLVLL